MLHFIFGLAVGLAFKRQIITALSILKKAFFARFFAGFQIEYNKRLRYRKEDLLTKGLTRLQEKNGGQSLNVVEIGAGAGANFEFMPAGVKLTCLEPNDKFESYLRANAKQFPGITSTKLLQGFAENMSEIASGSADAVICTLVLCSVTDVDKCLKEIIRILKPGGQFFFMEHVSADNSKFDRKSMDLARKLQHWLYWPWFYLLDCNVQVQTHAHVEQAGFSKVQLEHFDAVELVQPTSLMHFVSIIRSHLIGVATK